jgi:hypothetical protein
MTDQHVAWVRFVFFPLSALAAAMPAAAAPHYRAEPAAPVGAAQVVVRDLVWNCRAGGCVAGRSNSRPAVDCAALARHVGPLKRFSAGDRTLSAAQLEKCNGGARRGH